MARPEPVLIAGGGIAGLASALALAKRGIPSRILEQRHEPSEAGAGIQIGPNGVRVLSTLGVARGLERRASKPDEIIVHQGATSRVLTRMPLGEWIRARHGPYWVVNRRDLHVALLDCAKRLPLIELVTGFAVTEVVARDEHVEVRNAAGTPDRGPILIGADGIRSRVRAAISPDTQLNFFGKTASRTLLPEEAGRALGAPNAVGVWLMPGAHVVHYPVEAGRKLAVVAIVPDLRLTDDWAAESDWATLGPHLAPFSSKLTSVLATATEWRRWGLFEAAPPPRLVHGRIALAGDAAHPVLPFLAQGGVMALEDAVVLAHMLAAQPNDPARALAAYETARRDRVNAIVGKSRENGRIFHLYGPAAFARNLAMAALPAARLMARYDWVYGWRPPE